MPLLRALEYILVSIAITVTKYLDRNNSKNGLISANNSRTPSAVKGSQGNWILKQLAISYPIQKAETDEKE